MKCLICYLEFKDASAAMKHVFYRHDYTSKSYYDNFIRSAGEGICECGKETSFRGVVRGYLEFCSHSCYSNSEKTRLNLSIRAAGKKQSPETIRKRIEKTDQAKKEEKRKTTCLERYGVENTSQIPEIAAKISLGNIGKKCTRSALHTQKIVESRKIRGTNRHSDLSRQKISRGILSSKKFQLRKEDGTFVRSSLKSNGRTLCGRFNGLHFRSSYELAFLIEKYLEGVAVEPADNKKFSCEYVNLNKKVSSYYPDYFLPSTNEVIEIKCSSLCKLQTNALKFNAAKKKYGQSFRVLTEYDLIDISEIIQKLEIQNLLEILKNEHLCARSRSGLGGKKSLR